MAIDVAPLWDFNRPEVSEERFRTALTFASADDTLILYTQIARSYGLRGNFHQAQQILSTLEPKIQNASAEAQVYYYLELGRTYISATHPPEMHTPEAKELARASYMRAFDLAQQSALDGLAIDALHMMPLVDNLPEAQLAWNRKAITLMQSSSQPAAKKWEGALHNNTGYTLYQLGRYEDALVEFKLALTAYERMGNPPNIRIAHWMIAWTLHALGRLDEALEIQLRLDKEWSDAGEPHPFVLEELELLYKELGDKEKSEFYAARRKKNV